MKRMLGDLALNKHPGNWLVANNGTTGWPTYYGTSSDPLFSVSCLLYGGCPAMPPGRAPGGAAVQGNDDPLGGTDRHLTFIDQTTDIEFDLWHVASAYSRLPYNGGTIVTDYSGYTSITGTGRSEYGEGNAGHFGNLAGRIRIEEMRDALACATGSAGCTTNKPYINHALTFAVNCTSGMSVYPAGTNPGRTCSSIGRTNENAPPMGAHIHLNMSLSQINSLPLSVPEWKKVLLRTLAVYGAYINDTGSDFYFSWQLESGLQYTSMGVPDPWLSWAAILTTPQGTNDWWIWNDQYGNGYKGLWNTSNGINWDNQVWRYLEVLAQ